jgi:YHS domain-containing protein
VLDILFALVFVALIGLTLRRGTKDPVCGMTVDRHAGGPSSVYAGKTYYFCGAHCKHRFDEQPELFSSRSRDAASGHPTSHA